MEVKLRSDRVLQRGFFQHFENAIITAFVFKRGFIRKYIKKIGVTDLNEVTYFALGDIGALV